MDQSNSNQAFICIEPRKTEFTLSEWGMDYVILIYLMLPTIFIGIVGNLINMVILSGKEMRSGAYGLLAALALLDLIYLILLLPQSLANFDLFGQNYTYRYFFFATRTRMVAFSKWISATATWIVVAACIERIQCIHTFTNNTDHGYYRYSPKLRHCLFIVLAVALLTGLICFYGHFQYYCALEHWCNETQITAKCYDIQQNSFPDGWTNPSPLWLRRFVQYNRLVDVIVNFGIPFALIPALDAELLRYARANLCRSMAIGRSNEEDKKNDQGSMESLRNEHTQKKHQERMEHRATITVSAIVTCFMVTQGPAAILSLVNSLSNTSQPRQWTTARSIASFLFVFGEAFNFAIFCCSNANFRRRLTGITKSRMCQIGLLFNGKSRRSFSSKKKQDLHLTDFFPEDPD